MLQDVIVPEVSDGVTAGTVISIAVAVGDQVEEDQTLLELETDKAVVAIPSPAEGKIVEIKVSEGGEATVGSVIMVVDVEAGQSADGETEETREEAVPAEAESAESEAESPVVEEPQSTDREVDSSPGFDPLDLKSVRRGNDVAPAAPSVRRFARELGVDIHLLEGSGPGGRINEDDVRRFVRNAMENDADVTGAGTVPPVRQLPDFNRWGTVERKALANVRRLTADAMAYTWATVPMVTQYDKAGTASLEQFRQHYNRRVSSDKKLTMTAILLKICAAALKNFPNFNSSLDARSNELILKRYIHIGVAVDTPNGLLVPVLRNVDEKGIESLAAELNDIAERTRERKITPAELEGGTFTISNLGGIGGTAFTPLVYSPQVAILGVSRAETQPVWNGTEFVPELTMPLSLTYDHRVVDGADGARFLRWICEAIENPIQLVMAD